MEAPKSEYDLTLFFDLSADLLCISGFDGYFKKANPAICHLLGYTEAELLAQPINHFIHPEDQQSTQNHREQILKGLPLYHFENRYITRDGEIVWLTWTSMPVQSEQVIYAIAKNITHKKSIEADRNLLLTNLSKVNSELKQLALTSAHDLRAPVNNLLAIFSLLEESVIENPITQQCLDFFQMATKGLKESIDNHLRSINGQSHNSLEWIEINSILAKVLASIRILIQDTKTQIQIDLAAFTQLYFKRSNLESILLNLITNAIKYTKPGQPPQISIQTQTNDQGQKQLVIEDQGIGFDLSIVQDKIFGLHETFHSQQGSTNESHGIGLYLVHNHVTHLGAKIQLDSLPNQGSKFTITFKDPPQNIDEQAQATAAHITPPI